MKFLAFAAFMAAASMANPTAVREHGKVMGCYFGAWAFYREHGGSFDVPDIDPTLCTHGYYGFAGMNLETWEIAAYDPWYDLADGDCQPYNCKFDSYRRFVALKEQNPNFKPILSVGGWNYGSGNFSEMASVASRRDAFVASVVPFLKKFGFEGLDFDWEYPGSREGSDPEHDMENYSLLVEQLGAELRKENLIMTAALSPGKPTIDVAYDIPRLSKVFDLMNVMTYDYHGYFPDHNFTGENAPLYKRQEEDRPDHPGYYFNVYDTINYYMKLGAPKEKIVLGIPFYGRGFVLEDAERNGLYCNTTAGIPKGDFTGQRGFWGYQEIASALNGNTLSHLPEDTGRWTVVRDDCYKAPYAFNGPYWIGYDDAESVALKTQYANFLGVAGAFIWSVDTDDFTGGAYPLLKRINHELVMGAKLDPSNPSCQGTAPMCHTFDPTTTTTTTTPTTTPKPGLRCTADGEVHAYPGDCHLYYRCMDPDGDGVYDVTTYDCGDDVFDPNILACTDPGLPAKKLICGY